MPALSCAFDTKALADDEMDREGCGALLRSLIHAGALRIVILVADGAFRGKGFSWLAVSEWVSEGVGG